jgi:hypothetical protein
MDMTRRHAPRIARALLERFLPDSAPLAGDLIEDFERRQSTIWLWWQVLAAIATAPIGPPAEIRPLRLVDLQPVDALERSRRMSLRFRPVNLSASPLPDVGGLGLVLLASCLSVAAPGAWWALLGSTLAGVLLSIVIIAMHRKPPQPATTIGPHSIYPD